MTGFAQHGIEHLSASSLNTWAAEPALWVLERLLQRRSPESAIAVRGRAAEQGVNRGLFTPVMSVSDCVLIARNEFDRAMTLNFDDRREDERNNLAGYVEHALTELRQYGIPTGYQERVEIRLDDVPLPVIGYIDWRFDQHGVIVDLKTGERLPSSISEAHGRQGAVYATAHGNYGMRFAYTKPKASKSDGRAVVVYELTRDEIARHLAALRQIALRLGRFLALSRDSHELAGLLCPNYEAFYWANPTTRANGAAVYGF